MYGVQLNAGERGPLRAHIHHAARPTTDEGLRLSRFAEMWSAISIGLMLIGFVLIILFAHGYLIFGLVGLISLMTFIEAGFRRQLSQLVNSVTIGLSIVCALVLLFHFFWEIVIIAVLVAGGYIMWENLKELRA